jgi:hypothetical protein
MAKTPKVETKDEVVVQIVEQEEAAPPLSASTLAEMEAGKKAIVQNAKNARAEVGQE